MTVAGYAQRVRWSPHRIDMSRAMFGVALTPLPDVVAPTLERLPADIGAQLKRDFWQRHGKSPDWDKKHAAQDWLAAEVAEFEGEKIHRAFDDEEIRALAQRWSDLCMRMVRLEPMQEFARSVGIEPPEVKRNVTRVGAARRLSCPRWWRRQIRKTYLRKAEAHLRARGFVHKRRQVYASDRAVEHRRQRKTRDRAMLQEMLAVSDAGDQLELWDVVQKSQANPALRRAELMTRLRGFEEVAQAAGHVAEFVTLTCPSAFHRTHADGAQNERWEGFTPRQGQQWLSKMWARARAKLARLSVSIYGFRVAEPHHDGTPHWHLVLFLKETLAETLRTVLGGIWLKEYGHEPGAKKHRSTFKRIDPAKGSACGYLAKYIAKNIDGFEVGDDYETEGQKATESCDRVAAWASAHGIRQFQQVGGPSVSVWRELRRLRADGDVRPPAQIEAARQAADAGQWTDCLAALETIERARVQASEANSWSGFIQVLGGIEQGRRSAVRLWKGDDWRVQGGRELPGGMHGSGSMCWRVDVSSGLVLSEPDACNQYGEERPPQIVGVQCASAQVRTREKIWRIQRKAPAGASNRPGYGASLALSGSGPVPSLGPVSITVRSSKFVPSAEGGKTRRDSDHEWLAHIRGSPWTH